MIHTVKPGDTLYQLSLDYRVSLARNFYAANPGVNHQQLYAGQKIQIPGLPDPNTIPYSIQISVGKRRLSLYRNGKLEKIYPIAVEEVLPPAHHQEIL